MTELVRIDYIAKKGGYSFLYAYDFMRRKGIVPIKSLGIHYYPKAEVDAVMADIVPKLRRKQKQATFQFSDYQMEVIKFCRGDYAAKGSA